MIYVAIAVIVICAVLLTLLFRSMANDHKQEANRVLTELVRSTNGCRHLAAVEIVPVGEEDPVAWLCPTCDAPLDTEPAAVRDRRQTPARYKELTSWSPQNMLELQRWENLREAARRGDPILDRPGALGCRDCEWEQIEGWSGQILRTRIVHPCPAHTPRPPYEASDL